MFQTLLKYFYFPRIECICYYAAPACADYARERINIQVNLTQLRLFSSGGTLEDVAMELPCDIHPTDRVRLLTAAFSPEFSTPLEEVHCL